MNVDMELRKAFQELQTKMITSQQQLKVSDMQIEALKRQMTHAKLVDQEISTLPPDTRTYEGIGRMFLLQPIDTLKTNLDEKVKSTQEKVKTIESNKQYLERSMKESENSLRELVLSKQNSQRNN